jgi:hypothetical protein
MIIEYKLKTQKLPVVLDHIMGLKPTDTKLIVLYEPKYYGLDEKLFSLEEMEYLKIKAPYCEDYYKAPITPQDIEDVSQVLKMWKK